MSFKTLTLREDFMRYNQFSYIPTSLDQAVDELRALGFDCQLDQTPKANLKAFLSRLFFNYPDLDFPASNLIADEHTDLWTFLNSQKPLTAEIFYTVALQVLDFVPHVDFEEPMAFLESIDFPITYQEETIIINLHQLLATRQKTGMILVDKLVSQGMIPADNTYHYFNGKSLATFDTNQALREVVYVETGVDSDQDGQNDLIRVHIIRPNTQQAVPVTMTASPYHQGTNPVANDKKMHDMAGQLQVKPAGQIKLTPEVVPEVSYQTSTTPVSPAQESFTHVSNYTLNDYFLARGFANIYVSGIGTKASQGLMTSGDYQQVNAYRAVIDWLNGRATAYTSHKKDRQVLADWASGKVATTGISYLGTMSTALATTAVDGLEVIIAEAGISSWYDYYRENGLLQSPGGYPGEDLDVLTEFTYSRNLLAGDYLRHNQDYQAYLAQMSQDLERQTGDYNQFWHQRNYTQHAHQVKAQVVMVHGTQDWNVKPLHTYQFFKALPAQLKKHLFLHNGMHVYMNNWQSIDFRESINALLTQKLLGLPTDFELPEVIWQDNQAEQVWRSLDHFGSSQELALDLTGQEKSIQNQYEPEVFEAFAKNYQTFKTALFKDKANQITIDLTIDQDIRLNGRPRLELKLKSSTNKGLLSAQLLDFGPKKRYQDVPKVKEARGIDNGRLYMIEHTMELPFKKDEYRVISKASINLQNRTSLLDIKDIPADQWLTLSFELQPSIYQLQKGDQLCLVLYTTDFEHTIRDNTDYQLTIALDQSKLVLPVDKS